MINIEINKQAVMVLLLFIILDIITGLIKAVINHNVSSSVMREGVLKKVLEVIVVIVGFGTDTIMNTGVVGNGCIVFFAAMEGISILENTGEYIPLPEALKNALSSLKGE